LNATFAGRARVLGSAALSGGVALLRGVSVEWDAVASIATLYALGTPMESSLLDALLWAQEP
jgi:hypothetical protein